MPGVFFAGFASDRQPRALRDTLPFVVDATEKTIRLRARAHDGQVAHAEPRERVRFMIHIALGEVRCVRYGVFPVTN